MVFSSSKFEDLEAAGRTLLEETFWMDWWTCTTKSFSDMAKVRLLFVEGARCQLRVAKTVSTICVNALLKRCDAILGKVKNNISYESFMELCNTSFLDSTELFLQDTLERAIEKLSCVFHDEEIWKIVSIDKGQKKSAKKLQFTQVVHGRQSARCSVLLM